MTWKEVERRDYTKYDPDDTRIHSIVFEHEESKTQASVKASGCVDIDWDGSLADTHVCSLDHLIADLIDLRIMATTAYRGTNGEDNWPSPRTLKENEEHFKQFKATLAARYPDTYARVFGNG